MAYGARLESVLGESPRGFESPILRRDPQSVAPEHTIGRPGATSGRGSKVSSTALVTVRPRRSLIVTGFVSIAVAMVPVFGVLYWFSFEHGSWPAVLVVHVLVMLLAIVIAVRQLMVHSAVTETELIGNGIFTPMVRVPLSQIASVDLVETYVGQAPESRLENEAAGVEDIHFHPVEPFGIRIGIERRF